MGSKSYGYTVRTERLRVLGATELLACLLLIIVVCWLAFPRDLAITLRNARLDAVTLSYMQAWLKAKPDDHELRLLMARELIVLGRFDEADVQLDRVEAADAGYQSQVRWLRLQWDFKRLMAMEPELRDASRLQAETLASLRSQNWSTLNGDQRRELAVSESFARGLFEYSPVSLWVEDFSEVKALIDDVRERGITDFHFYTMNRADLVYAICHILGVRANDGA